MCWEYQKLLELNGAADLLTAACQKYEAVYQSPRPGLGMLQKNFWKMVVLPMLCVMQVSLETPFSSVEPILLTRPNMVFFNLRYSL